MATPTLPSSPAVHPFKLYSGFLISDLVGTVENIQPLPQLLYTLRKDDPDWYWMWKLEVNHFAPRFYATRNAAEKLIERYRRMLRSRARHA